MEGHQRAVVADVVHQHVDPPVLGQHVLGQPGDVVVDGDVDDMAPDVSARAGHFDRGSGRPAPDRSRRPRRERRAGRTGGRSRADAVAAAGDHRDPSRRAADSSRRCVRDAIVTGHSDGPYAACGRIASKMTDDDEACPPPPDDATSCGSPCSRRSCSGCSIWWRSPASSTSRISGARLPRRVPLAPLTYRRGVGGARRDLRARPDSGRDQRRAVRAGARACSSRSARRSERRSSPA